MTQISLLDLSKLRLEYPTKKIVFCSGNFDLTHVGHVLFFEDCKQQGNILIVGVASDNILKINKKRLIMNKNIRLKMVDSLKPVDYVLLDNVSNKENTLGLLDVVFKKLKPDVYIINDDASNIPYRKKICKKFDVKLVILKRTCPKEFENISTTKLIKKIKYL